MFPLSPSTDGGNAHKSFTPFDILGRHLKRSMNNSEI